MIETAIGEVEDPTARFFAYARERHAIFLRRQQGKTAPWTEDPILQKYRFTNVFREMDATTIWYRRYVREPMADRPELLAATVLFRWFNRMVTGETLFCQKDLITGETLFDEWLVLATTQRMPAATKHLHAALIKQGPPWTTGAYIINTAGLGTGMSKLDGVLAQFEAWANREWFTHAQQMQVFNHSMEDFCRWMQESQGMGPFMAYEVACDLRWTILLARARDICTWANPGPGARRGSARIMGMGLDVHNKPAAASIEQSMETMRSTLAVSRDPVYWPSTSVPAVAPADVIDEIWPGWEMREVEHTLCEWDKYERARLGQGRPRGTYP